MAYDLIVLGAGPAGYLGAERASGAGLKTLLIEKKHIGGVCLNEGCIPAKTLLYSAKIFDGAKNGSKYGIEANDINLDHGAVSVRKDKVVKTLVAGIKSKLKKNGADVVEGTGEIAGKSEEGYLVGADGEIFCAKRLLIATGAVPVIPPIPGINEGIERGYVLTNREILDLKAVPRSLAVIGGGVIGLEMASYFNSAGSRVTVVEMLDRIAGSYTDMEISTILMKNYAARGIDFRLNSRVVEIGGGYVAFESNGRKETVDAEKVLVSVGRKPASEGIGLERIGVELDRGRVRTDEKGKTNIPEVYAAGDVNGMWMLAHAAYREAEVCVNNMLGKKDIMRYDAIPSVIYTNPEVACIGETEESARGKGIDYEAVKLSMRYSGRYVAENEGGDGICKLIADKKRRKLIGAHMIGNYSSEIIYGVGIMIETELRIEDIKEIVFPHPTVSEIIREGIFEFK